MPRIIISDPNKGKAYQIEPEESKFRKLIGAEIGDQINGDDIGIPGYKLEIKGGSDEEGFPMRADVKGEGRTKPLLSKGAGYQPPRKGERQRKTVRGKKVSQNIAQLNIIVKEQGEKPIEKILGLEPEEEETEEVEKETEEESEKEDAGKEEKSEDKEETEKESEESEKEETGSEE